jgi:hypothetical protein
MKRTRKTSSAKASSPAKSLRRNTSPKKAQRQTKSKLRRKIAATATIAADPLDHLITASAHALDLKIDPAWVPTIRTNLHVILNHAGLVTELTLPDDIEPAPIFKA